MQRPALLALSAIASLAVVGLAGLSIGARSAHATPTVGPCFDQPNMVAALAHLRESRASLDRAEHNKGGWRVAAIAATDRAIAETERGCAIANR